MTYKVERWMGYEPAVVMNPFVWANYGQPQRHRGYVSPIVFQSEPPKLQSIHLGGLGAAMPRAHAARSAAYRLHPSAKPTFHAVATSRTSAASTPKYHAVTGKRTTLGQTFSDEATARAERMEKIAITGLVLSTISLGVYVYTTSKVLKRNRRRRR